MGEEKCNDCYYIMQVFLKIYDVKYYNVKSIQNKYDFRDTI